MQQWIWLVWLAGGVLLAGSTSGWRVTPWSLLIVAVAGALAWWTSPMSRGRSKRLADVMELPEDQRRVIVYWRPGCMYCERLRATLGADAERAQWINIWQDPEAAAYVRSVNDGNEVVPTVVIDSQPHTNPEPREVQAALAR